VESTVKAAAQRQLNIQAAFFGNIIEHE